MRLNHALLRALEVFTHARRAFSHNPVGTDTSGDLGWERRNTSRKSGPRQGSTRSLGSFERPVVEKGRQTVGSRGQWSVREVSAPSQTRARSPPKKKIASPTTERALLAVGPSRLDSSKARVSRVFPPPFARTSRKSSAHPFASRSRGRRA